MNFIDFIIVLVVAIILAIIIYFSFIKNRGKSQCASCASARKANNLVKEYYKNKCEGKDKK